MTLLLKRVYLPPAPADGRRVLVERLWPRGLSKEQAQIDLWAKEVAPSTELRRWFGHDPEKWTEFKRRYFRELDRRGDALGEIRRLLAEGVVTLVFAARETRFNNAVALKEYLQDRSGGDSDGRDGANGSVGSPVGSA